MFTLSNAPLHLPTHKRRVKALWDALGQWNTMRPACRSLRHGQPIVAPRAHTEERAVEQTNMCELDRRRLEITASFLWNVLRCSRLGARRATIELSTARCNFACVTTQCRNARSSNTVPCHSACCMLPPKPDVSTDRTSLQGVVVHAGCHVGIGQDLQTEDLLPDNERSMRDVPTVTRCNHAGEHVEGGEAVGRQARGLMLTCVARSVCKTVRLITCALFGEV